jgi:hypothetical protein
VPQHSWWQIASLGAVEILNSTRNGPKNYSTGTKSLYCTKNGSDSTSNANLPVWGLTYLCYASLWKLISAFCSCRILHKNIATLFHANVLKKNCPQKDPSTSLCSALHSVSGGLGGASWGKAFSLMYYDVFNQCRCHKWWLWGVVLALRKSFT